MIPAHSPIIKCMLSTKYKKWSTDSSYGRGAKSKLVLIEIIIIEVTAKNKLARLLPEDLTWNRDIATWACYTSLTACGFKWLIPSQVSFAIYRWSCIYVRKCASIVACVCMCVFMYVHTCVYNYGSPSAERETFLFGRAICWNRPAPFILSIIAMQERIEWKNDI